MNAPLDLRALLLDPANNGVYYFDRNDREDLAEAATHAGLHVAPVDFADCAGKHDALARIPTSACPRSTSRSRPRSWSC